MRDITYCANVDCKRFKDCKRGDWEHSSNPNKSIAGFHCEKFNWDYYIAKEKEDYDYIPIFHKY